MAEDLSVAKPEVDLTIKNLGFRLLSEGLHVAPDMITRLEEVLPLTVEKKPIEFRKFTNGHFELRRGQGRTPYESTIVLYPTSETPTVIHEFTHWLHHAHNNKLNEEQIQKIEQYLSNKDNSVSTHRYYEVLQNSLGIEQTGMQNLNEFIQRTGLQMPDFKNIDQKTLIKLIDYRMSNCSGEQLLYLEKELSSFKPELNQDEDFQYIQNTLSYYTVDARDAIRFKLKSEDDIEKYCRDSANLEKSQAVIHLNAVVKQLLISGQIDHQQVLNLFTAAKLPLDAVIGKTDLLKQHLLASSYEEKLQYIYNYFSSGKCNTLAEADIALDFLPDVYRDRINKGLKSDSLTPEEIEKLRLQAVAEIKRNKAVLCQDENYNYSRIDRSIFKLLYLPSHKADAMTHLAASAMIFFTDLPADEQASRNLLANPKYIQMMQEAILNSENSPLRTQLGTTIATFVENYAVTQGTLKEKAGAVFRNPSDLEMQDFIAQETNSLEYKMCPTEEDALADNEKQYYDALFTLKYILSQKHPDWSETQLMQEVNSQLSTQAVEQIENEWAINSGEKDLMFEPIAHVMSEILTGKTFNYQLKGITTSAYSNLLSAGDMEDSQSAIAQWHDKIRHLVQLVQQNGTLKPLEEFFQATDLVGQKKVLEKFARVKV